MAEGTEFHDPPFQASFCVHSSSKSNKQLKYSRGSYFTREANTRLQEGHAADFTGLAHTVSILRHLVAQMFITCHSRP